MEPDLHSQSGGRWEVYSRWRDSMCMPLEVSVPAERQGKAKRVFLREVRRVVARDKPVFKNLGAWLKG